jgi:uncharacterized protein YycO
MPEIRLQFVCEAALSSQAIAWFSSGHFSHVDCLLDDGTLLGARSDQVGGKLAGVQIRPQGYVKWARRVVMKVPCTINQKKAYHDFLFSQLGKPYDSEAIWAFLFNRNWRETDSWICSELQSAAGEKSGILPQLYLAANKITPVACALAFSAVGGVA